MRKEETCQIQKILVSNFVTTDDDRMRGEDLLLCNAMVASKRGGLHWVDNTQRSKVLSNAYPKTCESRPAKGGVGLV